MIGFKIIDLTHSEFPSLHHAICPITQQVVQRPYQKILSRQIRDGRQVAHKHLMPNLANF